MLVDGDTVNETDLNRQLFATRSNVGKLKTQAARKRLSDVSDTEFVVVSEFVNGDNVAKVLADEPDVVLDAIDQTADKLALIEFCMTKGIPLVSSMGAGGRLGPVEVKTADISETEGCALARKMRRKLRSKCIESGFDAVYSPQAAVSSAQKSSGAQPSSVFATAPFGFALAAAAVKKALSL